MVSDNGQDYLPYVFYLSAIPGFMDYEGVYSQFRILKCRLDIQRASGRDGTIPAGDNYLVVPSRAFAQTNQAVQGVTTGTNPLSYVPAQTETALRQTRWQKVLYPSAITQKIHTSFKPYTMTAAYGPMLVSGGAQTNPVWQRIYEGYKWMPFTWAREVEGANNAPVARLVFYGPYLVQNNVAGQTTQNAFVCTLTLYVQFRGQK